MLSRTVAEASSNKVRNAAAKARKVAKPKKDKQAKAKADGKVPGLEVYRTHSEG